MSNLVQNQNQTFQTPMLAMVTMDPQPQTFPAQIDPASTAIITAGVAVKLVSKAGTPNIVVDATTSSSDGPIFGVIPFNKRQNTYAAGDTVEVVGQGGVLMLKSSAAIVRGTNVTPTNPAVTTNDPMVATTTTAGDYILGVALGQAAGANELIKVRINPGKITASDAVTTASTP